MLLAKADAEAKLFELAVLANETLWVETTLCSHGLCTGEHACKVSLFALIALVKGALLHRILP